MLACIGLKLIASLRFVKNKLSAVHAYFFMRFVVLDAWPVLLLGIMAVTLSAALPWHAMSPFMRSNIAPLPVYWLPPLP